MMVVARIPVAWVSTGEGIPFNGNAQRLRQNVAQRFGIKRCRGLCGQQIY